MWTVFQHVQHTDRYYLKNSETEREKYRATLTEDLVMDSHLCFDDLVSEFAVVVFSHSLLPQTRKEKIRFLSGM